MALFDAFLLQTPQLYSKTDRTDRHQCGEGETSSISVRGVLGNSLIPKAAAKPRKTSRLCVFAGRQFCPVTGGFQVSPQFD